MSKSEFVNSLGYKRKSGPCRRIELHGRSKDLSDDELERAYFGFESAPQKSETHF